MKLAIVAHNTCWKDETQAGYVTTWGFSFHVGALSELFDSTQVIVPIPKTEIPLGANLIKGKDISFKHLDKPGGTGFRRKLALFSWMPKNLPKIWRAINEADAVYVPVPGDISVFGMLVALIQKKYLFVRYCTDWMQPLTLFDRLLIWFLPKIAGDRNAVMATGGSEGQVSSQNQDIEWIFSTTISEQEQENIQVAQPWQPGQTLGLVTVSRLDHGKNIDQIIHSIPHLNQHFTNSTSSGRKHSVSLDIAGEGPFQQELEYLAKDLGIQDQIEFHGNLGHEEVLDLLGNSHLFLLPSRREGFSKAVVEAMTCGLPVITNAVSVFPKLVGERCGLVIHSTDSVSIANAVIELTRDVERLKVLGMNAREAITPYTLEAWGMTIEERLQEHWGKLKE